MNLTIVLEGLQQDLQRLSELGDERSVQIAQRLSDALASNLRLKLFDLLSQVAVELSSKLPSGHIEVRLAGQEPELVFVDAPGEAGGVAGEELSARISLRLPESLKIVRREGGRARGDLREHLARARNRPGRRIPPRPRHRQAPSGLRPELEEPQMQKTFEVQGPVELDVRLASGDIEVDPTADGRVEIELIAHDEESQRLVDDARIELSPHGHRPTIVVDVPQKRGFSTSTFRPQRHRVPDPLPARLRACRSAPSRPTSPRAGTLGGLNVQTASGDVDIDRVSGGVNVKSASSDFSAREIDGRREHPDRLRRHRHLGRARPGQRHVRRRATSRSARPTTT